MTVTLKGRRYDFVIDADADEPTPCGQCAFNNSSRWQYSFFCKHPIVSAHAKPRTWITCPYFKLNVDHVANAAKCPQCGEQREERLVNDDGVIRCATCGTVYEL